MRFWLILLFCSVPASLSLIECNFAALANGSTTQEECDDCAIVHFQNRNFTSFNGTCDYSTIALEILQESCTHKDESRGEIGLCECFMHSHSETFLCTPTQFYYYHYKRPYKIFEWIALGTIFTMLGLVVIVIACTVGFRALKTKCFSMSIAHQVIVAKWPQHGP